MCRKTIASLLIAFLFLSGCPPDDLISTPPGVIPESRAMVFIGQVGELEYVAFSNTSRGIRTAFSRRLNGQLLELTPLTNGRTEEILQDQTGTVYDLFGKGSGGENDGLTLNAIPAGTAFWLVFGGLFPGHALNGSSISVPDTLQLRYNANYDIPVNSLFTGAQFGIIAPLDDPTFTVFNRRTEATIPGVLEADQLIGICLNGDTRLYPLPILAAHEIVNDVVGGIPVAITYSPLSGSARVWKRPEQDGHLLGVTGMLANSTMLMFDREQEANRYHQITGRCVAGFCRDQYLEPVNYLVTDWDNWRELISEVRVLLPSPSIDVDRARRMDARIKTIVPHGYPVDFFDDRLPEKTIVWGITDGVLGITFSLE